MDLQNAGGFCRIKANPACSIKTWASRRLHKKVFYMQGRLDGAAILASATVCILMTLRSIVFGWKKFVLRVAYQNSVMVVVQKNFLDTSLSNGGVEDKTQRTKRLCARRHIQRDKQALFYFVGHEEGDRIFKEISASRSSSLGHALSDVSSLPCSNGVNMLEQKHHTRHSIHFTITRYAEEPLGCGVLLPMNPSSCIDALQLFVGARSGIQIRIKREAFDSWSLMELSVSESWQPYFGSRMLREFIR